jgi:membrane protein DedA with SNARE-associated domain
MDTVVDLLGQLAAFIDSLTALVTDSPLTYLVIMGMAALDVLLPILPAEATVTAAAVLAGQGQLNIAWVMVAAGIGAFIGDNVAYWIGRVAGRPLVERLLRGNTEQLDGVAEQFRKRGGVFIVIGRFIPGGRTAVSIGAGVLEFSWPRFLLFDAIAAVVWSIQAALPGYIGGSLIREQPWLALIVGFVLSALLAGGIALGQRWWDRRRHFEVEVPIKPSVVGIGGVDARLSHHPSQSAPTTMQEAGAIGAEADAFPAARDTAVDPSEKEPGAGEVS